MSSCSATFFFVNLSKQFSLSESQSLFNLYNGDNNSIHLVISIEDKVCKTVCLMLEKLPLLL